MQPLKTWTKELVEMAQSVKRLLYKQEKTEFDFPEQT